MDQEGSIVRHSPIGVYAPSARAEDERHRSRWSGTDPTHQLPEWPLLHLIAGRTSSTVNRLGWLLLAVLILFMLGQVFGGVDQQDEGELFTYPWLIAQGYMPYRDIWMMYPPGTFLIITGLIKAGIPALVAERGISIIARLCYVLFVNHALTRSWTRFSWLGVPMSFSLIFLSTEVRAAAYIVGAPLLLLALLAARDRLRWSAALFIAAGLFRFEMGLAGVVCLAGLIALNWNNQPRRRQVGLAAASVLLGLVVIFLGLNALTGGQAIPQIFVYPALLVNPGRRLPLFPPYFGPLGVPIELILLLGPAFAAAAAIRLRRPWVAATSGALYCVVPQFLQRADWEHLCTASAIVMPWLLIGLTDLIGGPTSGISREHASTNDLASLDTGVIRAIRAASVSLAAAAGAWPTVLMLAWVAYFSSLSPFSHFHGWSDVVDVQGRTIVAHGATEARDDAEVANFLASHRAPGQRLFIAEGTLRYTKYNPLLLYYLTGIRPATKYLEMNPGVENQASVQREIVKRLGKGVWIVLWKISVGNEPNASSKPGSALFARWLHSHARLVFQDYFYQILRVTR